MGAANGEVTRTLNDMTELNNSFGEIVKIAAAHMATEIAETPPPAVSERRFSFSFKGSNVKTEKDKYNSKERRNSRYYVRNADKEAIQTRANNLKQAINTVMEHSGMLKFDEIVFYFILFSIICTCTDSIIVPFIVGRIELGFSVALCSQVILEFSKFYPSGLYDHKPRHGSRKHSLATLNIPANLISPTEQSQKNPPPPSTPSIIEPSTSSTYHLSTDETIVSNLSPLPDQRRGSMDEYFFNSLSLPVPKQFADAASRRSSGAPEPILEEEGNGHSTLHSPTKAGIETEYNYDVGYLCPSDDANCESAVPYEVYERNLLRAANMQQNQSNVESFSSTKTQYSESSLISNQQTTTAAVHMLQVPTISMSDVDMMERNLTNSDNVYTSDNMTIIDTDQVVSLFATLRAVLIQQYLELHFAKLIFSSAGTIDIR